MAVIMKAGGELVTFGSFAGGAPTRTSWGDTIVTRDAGIPLAQYSPSTADPLRLWKSQPSLRKVVSFIARQIGAIPWHAYERVSDTDRQRSQGSPAEQLLNRGSRFRSGYNLWRDVATDALMYDMFCVVYWEATATQPAKLVRIPPRLIEIKSNFLGEVEQVILRTPAGVDDVDLTDAPMAISWGWSPAGGTGVSPLFTLAQILEENKRSVEWRNAQWDNSPKLSGVLEYEKGFRDNGKRDRFLQSWRQWRDSARAGGTPILEDGMVYKPLEGVNPKDAKDIEGRQLTDAEVSSAFHIAPELVGARAGNFSNIGAFRQMLHGPTLGPLYTELTQAVNIGLLPFLDTTKDLYVEMDRDAAINGSFLEQAQIISTSTGGPFMTRAEGRSKLNLPFLDGTDELIVPMNVTAGGQASPQDSGSQNITPAKALSGLGLRKMIDAAVHQAITAKAGTEAAAAAKRDDMTEAIAAVLDGQQQAIAAAGLKPDAFRSTWDPVMAEAVRPHLGTAALAAARKVLDAHNPDEDGWSADGLDGYLDKMAETSAGGINAGVVTAVEDADEDTDLGDTFSALAGATALAWGASLASQAGAFGGHDAAKASGLGRKTWVVQSSNPRSAHASMDGETVAIDDTFSNGAKWPGDPGLDADESAGCMCAVEFAAGG